MPENDGFLTDDKQLQLAELVNIIIPKTDIPGAKELGVEKFISVMVRDCYNKEVKAEFLLGFGELNAFSKDFYGNSLIKLTEAERIDVLCTLEAYETPPEKKDKFCRFPERLNYCRFYELSVFYGEPSE